MLASSKLATPLCIHELFEEQAKRSPTATALAFQDLRVTYNELNARANQLAHRLIALGVRPDQPVAICIERSAAMIIGILAVLKAGGAYVPLDPHTPGDRLTFILADTDPTLIIADEVGCNALGPALRDRTVLDPNAIYREPDCNPDVLELAPNHLAYVIYTSGSTGQPKGVMVEHAQVVRLFDSTNDIFKFQSTDVWCLFHSFAFDFSIWEIWGALANGGTLVVVPQITARSPKAFYQLVCEHGVTVLNQTPSAFAALMEHIQGGDDRLRYIIFGGEALLPSTLRDWYQGRDDSVPQLVNMYGITETTVHVTCHLLTSFDANRVDSAIGQCLPDLQVYLLDAQGQPVPTGAVGEIYVGGAGVARGYLNRPELSAERFLDDPFSEKPGARMYRSGDLARVLSDGSLAFLGRNDDQVKIRGFRIELGEIAARLTEQAPVREAVVLMQGEVGEKRLVAYVVPHTKAETDLTLAGPLRAALSETLPEYMIPSAFVQLDSLPLTVNGKLDHDALPVPSEDAFAHAAYETPLGEIENVLADIWAELLGVERVGRHDNFFALGGHSLMAVRLLGRLRDRGLRLAVRDLFKAPVLSVLVSRIELDRDGSEVIPPKLNLGTQRLTPDHLPLIDLTQSDIDSIIAQVPGGRANLQDIYALSPLQEGILFHHMLVRDGDPYLLVTQMSFNNKENLDHYLNAVQQVVNRHDILRTAFVWEGLSTAAQVVWREAPLAIEHLSLDLADGPITEQLSWRYDACRYRINLNQAPLLRFVVAHDAAVDRLVLMQLQHHLIDDATSLQLFYHEIKEILSGRGQALGTPQPFRSLISQIRAGNRALEHEAFFKAMLRDITEPVLPFGISEVHLSGAQISQAQREIPAGLNDRLRIQARRLNASLASLCHVAFAQVLARATGQECVVFGTVLFGRMHAEHGDDRAMGMFINTLPLRLDLGDMGAAKSIEVAHSRLADLLAHEHASLALAQRCSGIEADAPLFNSLLNFRHNYQYGDDALAQALQQLPGATCLSEQERTNYPFTLSVDDCGHSLELTVQIIAPFDSNRALGYMEQALESLAHTLERSPDSPVRHLEVLPAQERSFLLRTLNSTQMPCPEHVCIHHMFEQQAARTPDAVALIFEDVRLLYRELNAQTNQMARELIKHGVKKDQLVGLCIDNPIDMVVGLIAILKAGGAYVPLDPDYPQDRLRYMLADAAPVAVLTDALGRHVLGEGLEKHTVLDCNQIKQSASTQPSINFHAEGLINDHLAYVIYTSGSTGQPKGVMVEHRALVASTSARTWLYKPTPGSVFLLLSSLAFDSSLAGLFGTLNTGGAVCLAQRKTIDPCIISSLLRNHAVSSLLLVPSLARSVVPQLSNSVHAQLRQVILAGETCPASTVQTLLHTLPNVEVFNEYGPTEATVWATVHRCCPSEIDPIPIGRPIPNTRIYILDTLGRPVPMGATGEIYIGGMGVARGYLHLPELTAERFLLDPYAEEPGAKMYKTGDLGRYAPSGDLVFLGRADHQVKLRGLRIELGEIAAKLLERHDIREAVVEAQGTDPDMRLVAYVVAETGRTPNALQRMDDCEIRKPSAKDLRQYLSLHLPDYMVPSAFAFIAQIPLTPNGKLDRTSLPELDDDAYSRAEYETPQGEAEITLAAMWSGLLGIEKVSRHDNFFSLGGHSLTAVEMVNRLKNFGFTCALGDIFKYPRLSDLALEIAHIPAPNPHAGIICVRSKGVEPPLFFVPSGLGDYSYVAALAHQIQTDCPIYVLPWAAVKDPMPHTLEEMAERITPSVKAVQPKGPYRILGYSSGGLLAYALAHELAKDCADDGFLGLIDVPTPQYISYSNHDIKSCFIDHVKAAAPREVRDRLDALSSTDTWPDLLSATKKHGGYIAHADSRKEISKWQAICHFAKIAKAYNPPSLLFKTHSFNAEDPSPDLDIMEGWRAILPDAAIESACIPGDHETLVNDFENRKSLATAITSALAQQ